MTLGLVWLAIKSTFAGLHWSGNTRTIVAANRNTVAGLHRSGDTGTGEVVIRNTVSIYTGLGTQIGVVVIRDTVTGCTIRAC